jgi:hypothetical protein
MFVNVVRSLGRADKFIKLHLNRFRVPALDVLNQKHHQKRDDRGASVDHQLPRIAEVKNGSGDNPQYNHTHRDGECSWSATDVRRDLCKSRVPGGVVHMHSFLGDERS